MFCHILSLDDSLIDLEVPNCSSICMYVVTIQVLLRAEYMVYMQINHEHSTGNMK